MRLLGGLGGEENIASLPGLVRDVTVSAVGNAFAARSSPPRFDSPARFFLLPISPEMHGA